MRLDVGLVGKLAGQKDVGPAGGEFLGHADAAQEAALLAADRDDLRAQALDHQYPLAAHPVGHEDRDRMAEGAADGGERDAGVAAGGLGDLVAGLDSAVLVCPPQDVQRHAVLDAAGEVEILGLGVDDAIRAAVTVVDSQQWRIAHQDVNGLQTLGYWAASPGLGHPHLLLSECAGDATKKYHTMTAQGPLAAAIAVQRPGLSSSLRDGLHQAFQWWKVFRDDLPDAFGLHTEVFVYQHVA